MIIESSFYKIPEILHNIITNSNQTAKITEGFLVNCVSMAVLTELNSRNIPNPFHRIQMEKPYPNQTDKKRHAKNAPCDLFVSLKDIYHGDFSDSYSISNENYCEAKFFMEPIDNQNGTLGRRSSSRSVGEILNDLSRLQRYTNEDNGRYFFVFFYGGWEKYLGVLQKSQEKKKVWLNKLFSPGYHADSDRIEIDIEALTPDIKAKVKTGETKLSLDILTYQIAPKKGNAFNGYLLKILNGAGDSR